MYVKKAANICKFCSLPGLLHLHQDPGLCNIATLIFFKFQVGLIHSHAYFLFHNTIYFLIHVLFLRIFIFFIYIYKKYIF